MEGDTTTETTLLASLDRRQDEVIAELDRLNEKVASVIADWTNAAERPFQ